MSTLAGQPADTDLLKMYARTRDAQAFAELARRYAGLVYGTAMRITHSDADARDVCQECFLRLARQARCIRPPLAAWLHLSARSRAIDCLRRSAVRRKHEQNAATQRSTEVSEWEAIEPQIDAAIEALPIDLRDLVTQHYLCGVSQTELRSSTGLSQATISRRLTEAVEQLRQSLEGAGVSLSVVALSDMLAQVSQVQLPATLVASLGRMAISGVGSGTAGVAATLLVAAVVAIAAGGVIWQMTRSGSALSQSTPKGAASVATVSEPSVELPRTFAIRLINLPPLKVARSGDTDLAQFDAWWSAISRTDKFSITPRDFMWANPRNGKQEWVYALPPGVTDTAGYATFDFLGGLYAVTSCREDDIGQAYDFALNWMRQSGAVDLDDKGQDRYSMIHVITPPAVKAKLGFNQMDLFVPVAIKPAPAVKGNLMAGSFAIRIVEIPPLRMARSRAVDVNEFARWWSAHSAQDRYSTSPRDFMWYNADTRKEEWLYALPQGVSDTGPYEELPFPGGLYAVSCCRESELAEVGQYVREWVRRSGHYDLDETWPDHNSMCHIITPGAISKVMGFSQMDFFMPIKPKRPATVALPTPDPKRYEGLWFPDNEPLPKVLRGMVEMLNEDLGTAWAPSQQGMDRTHLLFMGITGDAFWFPWITAVPRNPQVPVELYHADPSPLYQRALAAAGITCDVFAAPRLPRGDAEPVPLNVPDLKERVLTCLVERKMPVVAGGIPEQGQYMLVTGYEDGGNTLVGYWTSGGQGGVRFRADDMKKASKWQGKVHLAVIPTGRQPRPTERQTFRDALVQAEMLMRRDQLGLMRSGPAFFDAWADTWVSDDALVKFGPYIEPPTLENRRRLLVCPVSWEVDERTLYAIAFLTRAESLFPEASEELAAVRAALAQVGQAAHEVSQMMGPGETPREGWPGIKDQDKCRHAADLIRRSKAALIEAADHLGAALARIR